MILQDRMPEHILSIVEERMGGHGLGLHELAVLAATLEPLVHEDAMDRLRDAYQAHKLSTDSASNDEQVEEVLDTYIVATSLGPTCPP
jgi:hypothetical protein